MLPIAEAFGDRDALKAAELVAFDALEPVLRSRGHVSDAAREFYSDPAFREEVEEKLTGKPDGRLVIHTLDDALEQIERLEERVRALEKKVDRLTAS